MFAKQARALAKAAFDTGRLGKFSFEPDALKFFREAKHNNKTFNAQALFHGDEAFAKQIVFGDIHGDLKALLRVLLAAGVVSEAGDWQARDVLVVSCGDMVDAYGRQAGCDALIPAQADLFVLQYTHFLKQKAFEHNSRFVTCLGNHEAFRPQYLKYAGKAVQAYGGKKQFLKLFTAPAGLGTRFLARNFPLFCVNGNVVCMHAEIPQQLTMTRDPQYWNAVAKKALNGERVSRADRDTLDQVLTSRAVLNDEEACNASKFSQNLVFFGVNPDVAVVFSGHTTQHNLRKDCQGRLIALDFALSDAFVCGREETTGYAQVQQGPDFVRATVTQVRNGSSSELTLSRTAQGQEETEEVMLESPPSA